MNKNQRFYGARGNVKLHNDQKVVFSLDIILFEEDGATICYCPALDLSGYGVNESEALESFRFVVTEYFDYTSKKQTLQKDLQRLGWNIRRSVKKKMIPPAATSLLEHNSNFKRVFDNFDYKKFRTSVEIPAFS